MLKQFIILINLSGTVRPCSIYKSSQEEALEEYNSDKFVYAKHKVSFLGEVSQEEAMREATRYNTENTANDNLLLSIKYHYKMAGIEFKYPVKLNVCPKMQFITVSSEHPDTNELFEATLAWQPTVFHADLSKFNVKELCVKGLHDLVIKEEHSVRLCDDAMGFVTFNEEAFINSIFM